MNNIWILLAAIIAAVLLLAFNTNDATLLGVSNDRLASLLFLGILGTAIVASSRPRFHEWRKILRDMMLWALIILVFMVGFTYRYELQDMGSRLTSGLIPGSPISSTSLEGREQVTLIKGRDGHYRASALVDGVTVDFLVDTGASSIVLSHQDALAAGVEPSTLRYNIIVSTANGETRTARLRFNRITLGGIKRENISAMIAQDGDLDTSLLGMTFLGDLSGLQIKGDHLILTD